ncbi:F-box only protein 5 [Notolabrus celidotus]|uniref:F-box only protein 5 n=1 Tax=Notolabrus celidotus TaxID=1203425 RepID=UPI00148F5AE3|nr:F-box only protein 5 [Notolabrus celidotus]
MKCPSYEAIKANNMERSSAAESKVFHLKASPVKEPSPIKSQYSPANVTTVLFSLNNTGAVNNKENSTSKDYERCLEEVFEDSGYLSLHNSQIEDHHGEEDHIQEKQTILLSPVATRNEKTVSPKKSPSKSPSKYSTKGRRLVLQVAASTPVDYHKRRVSTCSLSSTPTHDHSDHSLPILKFQRDVCEKLAKSYHKNKRYDWSIPSQVAEDHLLDRVIGGQMGLEYVDVFSSLLTRNMRGILTKILAMLSDMDLISCKKVSRTWKRIICADTAALSRCQKAKQAQEESRSSLKQKSCSLTRDVAVSRLVLSSMQTLASSSTSSSSSSTSSSSSLSCRVNRRSSQKGSTPNSQCTRFNDYVQAASSLKQHESLRSCKRCGSPATYSAEARRATCMRLNCQFDFCTHCQQGFHGSTPCRVVQPRAHFPSSQSTQIIPGSARSKRNIRRL